MLNTQFNNSQKVILICESSNITFPDLDSALYNFGYIYSIEYLHLFLFTPLSLMGFILNIVCLFIFNQKEFRSIPLYYYLKIYTVHGLVINFVEFFYSFTQCVRLLSFISNTYEAHFFVTYIYIPVFNTCQYCKFLIDLLIIWDRIETFKNKVPSTLLSTVTHNYYIKYNRSKSGTSGAKERGMIKISMRSIIWFICIFSLLFNAPYLLAYVPGKKIILFVAANGSIMQPRMEFYYARKTQFYKSTFGFILMNFTYFVKNLLTFLAEIALNIVFCFLFKTHFAKKRTRLMSTFGGTYSMVENSTTNDSVNQRNNSLISKKSLIQSTSRNFLSLDNHKVDKKLTKTVILMSCISIVHHTLLLSFILYYLFSFFDLIAKCLAFSAHFSSVIRHSTPFFIFYVFNKNFRNEFKMLFFSKYFNMESKTTRKNEALFNNNSSIKYSIRQHAQQSNGLTKTLSTEVKGSNV
jgi:hypothetical protein